MLEIPVVCNYALLLFFLICADAQEREHMQRYMPTVSVLGFESQLIILCVSLVVLSVGQAFSNNAMAEQNWSVCFVSEALLLSSWIAFWVYHYMSASVVLSALAVVMGLAFLFMTRPFYYWCVPWLVFLLLHTWTLFHFVRSNLQVTRFGSRTTPRMGSVPARPNADAYVLPTQNPVLLVAETVEDQYRRTQA